MVALKRKKGPAPAVATGALFIAPDPVESGHQYTVSGGGFEPGSWVQVWIDWVPVASNEYVMVFGQELIGDDGVLGPMSPWAGAPGTGELTVHLLSVEADSTLDDTGTILATATITVV